MHKTFSLAIDGNEANVPQRVGSNAYAYELLKAIEELTREDENISVTVLLATSPLKDLPKARKGWSYRVFGPRQFWTQFALPLHLFWQRQDYDVLFTPGHYAPRVSAVPYISSVMDLAYLHFPKQFRRKDYLQLREWTRYSVKHAAKVVAISEFTKKDVIKQYHLPASKIVIAYPSTTVDTSIQLKERERLDILKKWNIKHPFLLYVGTLQPRKNLIRLIEAFEKVAMHTSEKKGFLSMKTDALQLVIAGKIGWLADEILERIDKSPLKNRIILTGYISEKEKAALYRECWAAVLIGLYEGFGIPPLEAMYYGTVPLVSSTTSLPEVVGDAGVMVDPENVESIAQGIIKILDLPAKERAKYLKRGRQQIKKFSWHAAAEVIIKAVKEVTKS